MVSHHIPECSRFFVVFGSGSNAERFGRCYFDEVDIIAIPYRLEQRIAETEHHQVLDRLLTQVMVYAVDLLFLENLGNFAVELTGALEVAAERFFDYYPRPTRFFPGQSRGAQSLDYGGR